MNKKLLKVIRSRRQEYELHGRDPEKYDLLDIMLTSPLRSGEEVKMSDELIRANLMTILSAGHSTTTSMLSWTCNFLFDSSLGNTDYRYALIQEISNISNGERRYIPTVHDIYKNLNFMTCVLKESLRLCPPIPTIVRHCLKSTNLGGYKISKGEAVMISCLGTHLNPKSWDNPSLFDPCRFEKPLPHPCSFIPWAGGARQCIGREFALLTGRIGLFLLLNQYNVEMSSHARVREDEHLFVFPDGLLMNTMIRKDIKLNQNSPLVKSPRFSNNNQDHNNNNNNQQDDANKNQNLNGTRAWDGLKALIREKGHTVRGFFKIFFSFFYLFIFPFFLGYYFVWHKK